MNHMPTQTAATKNGSRSIAPVLPYGGLSLVWLLIVLLSVTADNSSLATKYRLSTTQLHSLQLAVSVPGLVIWLTILFAAISIGRYARTIAGSKEGPGFRLVAYSLFALLAGLVANSFLGGLKQVVVQHAANPQAVDTAFVVLNNYVSVVAALASYGLLLHGSKLLLRSIGKRLDLAKKLLPVGTAFVALTIAYLWLIHGNPARQMSSDPVINTTFGLPYWLIVCTVALPFVAAWLIGVLALIGVYQYRAEASGIIYKLLFRKLVVGMTLFIGLTISLQLFIQLYSLYATRSLSSLLGIVAVVYLILAYGFILIAQGARKLNKIETLLIE